MPQDFSKSKKLLAKAKGIIPRGTNSGARATITDSLYEGFPLSMPAFIDRGKDAHLFDVDGNEFIDYHCSFGAIILGHANPAVGRAIKDQVDRGTSFAVNTEAEIKLTEKFIRHVPCAEQVMLSNTGSEACSTAVRLARAHTGKQKILKFEGHYHGWHDWNMVNNTLTVIGTPARGIGLKTLSAAGVPESVYNDVIVLPWNDPELLEKTVKREADRIAAVITEGYQANWGVIPAEKGYLELMRKLTKQNDIVFIMDEVITGFRLGYGGAQELTGVVPDISPLSKAVANGIPIAAVVGQKKFFEAMSSESTYFAGTFNGNSLSTAAALATITELESHGSYSKVLERGMKVMDGIRDALADNHIPGIVQGPGTMWSVFFTDLERVTKTREVYSFPIVPHVKRSALFYQGIVKRGIFLNPTRYGRMYFSWAHTEEDVKSTIEACQASMKDIKRVE